METIFLGGLMHCVNIDGSRTMFVGMTHPSSPSATVWLTVVFYDNNRGVWHGGVGYFCDLVLLWDLVAITAMQEYIHKICHHQSNPYV